MIKKEAIHGAGSSRRMVNADDQESIGFFLHRPWLRNDPYLKL